MGGQGTGPNSAKEREISSSRSPYYISRPSPRPGPARQQTTHFPTKPDQPRSSEPILIPKLRIEFADFPYLHYPID